METKILSPKGRLLAVEQVVPIIEQTFQFNGEKRFFGEVCKRDIKPNGIAIKYSDRGNFNPYHNEIVIGNLKTEKVNEIMQALLLYGSYDFSTMKFQKAGFYDEVVLDDGRSDAYTSEITKGICRMYNANANADSDSGIFGTPLPFNNSINLGSTCCEDTEENCYDEE